MIGNKWDEEPASPGQEINDLYLNIEKQRHLMGDRHTTAKEKGQSVTAWA